MSEELTTAQARGVKRVGASDTVVVAFLDAGDPERAERLKALLEKAGEEGYALRVSLVHYRESE